MFYGQYIPAYFPDGKIMENASRKQLESIDKKVFATLFSALFAAVMGVGIVVPLLPVYAEHLGGSGIAIALIFGGFSLSRTIFLPIFGAWSDRHGRKPFLVAGLFSYFLISLAFISATRVVSLIWIRVVQGVASAMIMPVAQAYVGDITPEGREGFSMGLFNISVFLGLSIGPFLGGGIKDIWGLDAAFAIMGGLAFVSFLLCGLLLPPVASEHSVVAKANGGSLRLLAGDRIIRGIFIFRLAYTTCIGVVWAFLPVYADTDFSLSSTAIGILVMLGVSISGILHLPMGIVADRRDKRILIGAGGIIVAIAMVLVGTARGFWDLFCANIVFGIGGGIAIPSLMAIAVIQGNRRSAMGSVMALVTVAHSLGMFAGSLLAGFMMDGFGLRYAFFAGAVAMAAGTIATMVFIKSLSKVRT